MATSPRPARDQQIADEQAALRRVALVAGAAPPEAVFASVAEEAGQLLGVDFAVLVRYGPDSITITGTWTRTGAPAPSPVGTRLHLGGRNVTTLVSETGRSARIDYADASGPIGDVATGRWRLRSSAGVPVSVEGQLWGAMVVALTREKALPADTETRLAGFTELIATAIANAQARTELRAFAEEQAALRRVATLVARAARPDEVFAAVTDEAGRLLSSEVTVMSRYDPNGTATVVAAWTKTGKTSPLPVGRRLKLGGRDLHTLVSRTGQPARIGDFGDASEMAIAIAREASVRSGVGVPVRVEGQLWGVIGVTSRQALPADTEARLAGFTELAGTAIANAEAQAALKASRARIVAAGDSARRRIEQDLHDGAQQRLVSLALQLRAAQAAVPAGAAELAQRLDGAVAEADGVLEELREIARGLHPAVLAQSGLRPALRALARRSPVPVQLDIRVAGRLPEPTEVAAYYAVAEALTNTAKHARASVSEVEAVLSEGVLHVRVGDDGCGGADFHGGSGSGLAGLRDRVEAIGGRIRVHSPPGAGTFLDITLPLDGPGEPGSPPPAAGTAAGEPGPAPGTVRR